jgi:uncharacterized damage-inducible protein DinB
MDATLLRMQAYNNWANKILLSHLMIQPTLPPACLKLMQHIANTQSIWISRILSETPTVGVWEEHNLASCLEIHQESAAIIDNILTSDMDLAKDISYVNTQGNSFTNAVQDILIHVFNHATYHRAQIAKELRANGLEPLNTDYISFVRLTKY